MKKTPFNQLPVYKAIRGSKLSKRAQDEVLVKLKKYRKCNALDETEDSLATCINRAETNEGIEYWAKMHLDSGL